MVSEIEDCALEFSKCRSHSYRVHTFKIGVYPPAILPMLAVYSRFVPFPVVTMSNIFAVSLAMEAIGDITASAEVSRVPVNGEEFDSRIQGGVLVSSVP